MAIGIILFFGFFISLYIYGRRIGNWKLTSTLIAGWTIKCLAACGFFYVYSEIYGNGQLAEDAGAYYDESRILNDIYKDNKTDYYNVIFNKHNYEQTIIKYFKNVKISRIGPSAFLVNDTRNQIKFISLLSLVIGEDILSIFVFFAILSFIGLLVLWKAISKHTSINSLYVFILLLLPFSLLFWTSSPLKECTSIFGLQLFFAAILYRSWKLKWLLVGGLGLLFTWLFKPYIIAILLMGYLLYYAYRKIIFERKWSYLMIIGLLIGVLFYFSIPKKVLHTLSDKQFDFVNVARGGVHMEGDTCYYFLEKRNRDKIIIKDSVVHLLEPTQMIAIERGKIRREQKSTVHPGQENLRFEYEQFGGDSFFQTKAIDREWSNLFIAIPEAIFNAFLRPFAWSNFFSILNLVFFLENLVFIYLLTRIFKGYKLLTNIHHKKLIGVLMLSSFLFAIVIGLTSPISGAIVRYRIPIHLFILISYIITRKKYDYKSK